MSETDALFTQTIVGAPLSVLLGRQIQAPRDQASEGLQIDLATGTSALSPSWRSWVIVTQACAPVGIPRMRPVGWRRWLERHALALAVMGLLAGLLSAVHWSLTLWR